MQLRFDLLRTPGGPDVIDPRPVLSTLVEHLLAIRELQDETGGFTAFIPWTFQPANTALEGCYPSLGGHAYLTVEEIDQGEIAHAFEDGTSRGWPIVFGEVIEGDTAGYHFYPERGQVELWLRDAGFDIIEEADEPFDGYAYHHLLLRTRTA